VIEKVTPEIQEKILKDASYDKKNTNMLLARGGYFNSSIELTWAINKEKNYYFLLAPALPQAISKRYFFYFKKNMYILVIASEITNENFFSTGYFKDVVDRKLISELESEVRKAYLVYGPSGKGRKYRESLGLVINQMEAR